MIAETGRLLVFPTITGPARLAADPPIDGPIWTVVVPALLLIVAVAGTYLLYRRFAREHERQR